MRARSWGSNAGGRCVIGVLVAAAISFAGPATASAARLYVAVGDSVGAGLGATSGQSYFDQYCTYLESATAGSLVDQCVNDSLAAQTTDTALNGGSIAKAVSQIEGSTDTPVVTVVLGGNDLIGSGCEPITTAGCNFIHNMRKILNELETALGTLPGPHVIQWLEYYNPNHNNPFGNAAQDQATAGLLLGSDNAFTDCSSTTLALIGLDDAINCIAREKGATPVDAYTPFANNCTAGDCFWDSLHPDDKGYGLIFDAFRDTPGTPVPGTPPPDGTWPFDGQVPPPAALSAVTESRRVFAPRGRHHRRGGTVFSFKLSAPAKVNIAVRRLERGRRVGQHCRRPTVRLRHDQRCTRVVAVTTLSKTGRTGVNTIPFSGRVRGRPLKPGRYSAVFTVATSASGAPSSTLRFRVIDAGAHR